MLVGYLIGYLIGCLVVGVFNNLWHPISSSSHLIVLASSESRLPHRAATAVYHPPPHPTGLLQPSGLPVVGPVRKIHRGSKFPCKHVMPWLSPPPLLIPSIDNINNQMHLQPHPALQLHQPHHQPHPVLQPHPALWLHQPHHMMTSPTLPSTRTPLPL